MLRWLNQLWEKEQAHSRTNGNFLGADLEQPFDPTGMTPEQECLAAMEWARTCEPADKKLAAAARTAAFQRARKELPAEHSMWTDMLETQATMWIRDFIGPQLYDTVGREKALQLARRQWGEVQRLMSGEPESGANEPDLGTSGPVS